MENDGDVEGLEDERLFLSMRLREWNSFVRKW